MPEEGVCQKSHQEMLTEDEMILAVECAAELGISKVRITGGEPLVKKNIVSICDRIAHTPGIREVAITTNGILLPKYADQLRQAGVHRVNISLDTLNPNRYSYITRIGTIDQAIEGIESALRAGFEKVKLNSVLIGGFNDDEIADLAKLTQKWPVDMRFIEMMPMYDSGDFSNQSFIPYTKVLECLPEAVEQPRDGSVAKLFRLPGAKGNIGLISPVSAHFCKECNRVRLTADGKLKPCLHSREEYGIKGLERDEILNQFKRAILSKPEQHERLAYDSRSNAGRNMNQIGG